MKVMIVGVGKLGSQVAWSIIRELEPKNLYLSDIKDLKGDVLDLEHACVGMNLKTDISAENPKKAMDFIVITAGFGRSEKITTHEQLWELNKPVMADIIESLKTNGNINIDTKIVVMTNPVERMTDLVRNWLPGNIVMNPEAELMKIRNGEELGWEIVKTKGYSSFGPAISVTRLLKRFVG